MQNKKKSCEQSCRREVIEVFCLAMKALAENYVLASNELSLISGHLNGKQLSQQKQSAVMLHAANAECCNRQLSK